MAKLVIERNKLSMNKLLFLFYSCALMAHNTDNLIDDIIKLGTFFAFIIYALLNAVYKHDYKINIKGFLVWSLLMFGYLMLSTLWALNRSDALYKAYIFSFIQIIATSYVLEKWTDTSDECIEYLKLFMFSALYMIIRLAVQTPISAYGTDRMGNILGLNSNSFGIRCAMGSMIALYFAQKNRRYYVLSLVFIVYGLLSGSRKVFFMILIGYGLFLIMRNRNIKLIRNVLIVFILSISLYFCIMNIPSFYSTIGRRVEYFINSLTMQGKVDHSITERSFYRNYAFSMFLQKPIFGWGSNGFVTQMRNIGYSHVAYSHCNYTELLSTLGIVGFCIYYSMQTKIVFQSLFRYLKEGQIEILFIFVAIAVNMVTEYYYVSFYGNVTQLEILLLYLLLSRLKFENKEQSDE